MKITKTKQMPCTTLQDDLLCINKVNCCKISFLNQKTGYSVSPLMTAVPKSSSLVKKDSLWSASASTHVILHILREAKGPSSLEVFQIQLDKAMADLI